MRRALALALALLASSAAAESRVVVAGGDLTEIAFTLGAGDRIVGVDTTSTYPEAATDLPQIGYLRSLSAEGVLSLSPDLLLVAADAGPAVALKQIEAAGVDIAHAPDTPGAPGVPEKIRFMGRALGQSARAEALAAEVEAKIAAVAAEIAGLSARPRVLFILQLQGGAPLVGGAETSADEMIRLAGGRNAAAAFSGYKPMSREALIAAAPDVVLMMAGRAEASGGLDAVLARPDLALTPAGRAGRGVEMDDMLLLGFGPRTPAAIATLARALHPGAAIGGL